MTDYATSIDPADIDTPDDLRAAVVARQPFAGPVTFALWVMTQARCGDRCVYHVGNLAVDCGAGEDPAGEAEAIARRYRDEARRLMAAGHLALTQIRLREGLALYCGTVRDARR